MKVTPENLEATIEYIKTVYAEYAKHLCDVDKEDIEVTIRPDGSGFDVEFPVTVPRAEYVFDFNSEDLERKIKGESE